MSTQLAEKVGIELIHVVKKRNAKPSYRESGRKTNGFIYYLRGGHSFSFPNNSFRTKADDLLFLPYGASYCNKLRAPDTEYYEINFVLFENGTPVRLFNSARLVPPDVAKELLPYIRQTYLQYLSGERAQMLLCISNVLHIIGRLQARFPAAHPQAAVPDKIKASVEYLKKNYRNNTPVTELAAMSYTSVSNLELLFRKTYGMTPVAYRNMLRLNRAKQLLADGFTIEETAAQTGFRDPVYFSKTFKKRIGTTPGEYRKRFDLSV